MKIKNLSALFALIAGSLALLPSIANASPDNDRKIEDAATSSYNFRTVLNGSVTVKATDGVVTLTGTVPDKDDKALAADTVSNLPAVTSVNNQIVVAQAYPEHSDGWIAFKIHWTLLTKANVSAVNTTVVVTDGNVVLSGTADNLAQKELTGVYAKDIDGVKSVNNEIIVQNPPPGETVGENIDDASITTQVRYALLTHGSTSALKTKVSTANGVVLVSGDADSDAEISLVTKLASDVRGTKSVTNNMTVVPAKS
jgi:hyperosmotically inducible periplasmic protein